MQWAGAYFSAPGLALVGPLLRIPSPQAEIQVLARFACKLASLRAAIAEASVRAGAKGQGVKKLARQGAAFWADPADFIFRSRPPPFEGAFW